MEREPQYDDENTTMTLLVCITNFSDADYHEIFGYIGKTSLQCICLKNEKVLSNILKEGCDGEYDNDNDDAVDGVILMMVMMMTVVMIMQTMTMMMMMMTAKTRKVIKLVLTAEN